MMTAILYTELRLLTLDIADATLSKKVIGHISLRISYDQQSSSLNILVAHIRGLRAINRQAPNSYVKMFVFVLTACFVV